MVKILRYRWNSTEDGQGRLEKERETGRLEEEREMGRLEEERETSRLEEEESRVDWRKKRDRQTGGIRERMAIVLD